MVQQTGSTSDKTLVAVRFAQLIQKFCQSFLEFLESTYGHRMEPKTVIPKTLYGNGERSIRVREVAGSNPLAPNSSRILGRTPSNGF